MGHSGWMGGWKLESIEWMDELVETDGRKRMEMIHVQYLINGTATLDVTFKRRRDEVGEIKISKKKALFAVA